MSNITISVVICHHEQPEELRRCLRSVSCQLRPADQVVIVDDCSSEPPKKSLLETACNCPITLVLNENNHGGPATPRNQAIDACQSTHLVFLDADDLLMPNTLFGMESIWAENPLAIAHGDQISWGTCTKTPFLQRSFRQQNQDRNPKTKQLYKHLLMEGNQLFLSGTGGATTVFHSHRFDPSQHWEDYDLWLSLAQSGHQFVHTGLIHTLYRIKKGSRSGSRRARQNGCKGIKQKHLMSVAPWQWPLWYWKQRFF